MHLFSFSSRVNPAQPNIVENYFPFAFVLLNPAQSSASLSDTCSLCYLIFQLPIQMYSLINSWFFFSSLAFTFLILSPFTDVCNPSALIFKSHVSCSLKWNQQSEKFNKTIGAQHGCLWKCFFIENRFMHYKKMIR